MSSFLRGGALCAVAAVAHATGQGAERDAAEGVASVLILGGGMAGAAAASTLVANNVTDFLILEARDYLGGRLHSEQFGTGINKGIVEVGANWIHGVSDAVLNPIHKLAEEVGLKKTVIPGSCANVSGYPLFHDDGTPVEKDQERIQSFLKSVDCVNQTFGSADADLSMTMAMERCGFTSHDAVDATLLWEAGAANDILRPSEQSVKWIYPDDTYARLGPDDFFVHDQRPRGYAQVLDQLLHKANVGDRDPRIVFNAEITKVRVQGQEVEVQTADGRKFRGRSAVATLPLAVMQATQASLFDSPPLPAEQVKALNQFTMGNFTKIFAMWPEAFWREHGYQWLAADSNDMPFGMPMEFHDIGALVPGFHTLFTYIVGDNSPAWEGMTDEVAAVMLVNRLRRLFPGKDIPYPSAFKMTRHGSDPFMRGAYTTVKVGVPFSAMGDMNKPVSNRIFFAGEHTCEAFQGYLHGAYMSGLRAATQALKEMGHKVDVNEECDQDRSRRSKSERVFV